MRATVWLKSKLLSFVASDTRRHLLHVKGRLSRRGIPVVHYFHQVDDPYSHLAVQKIQSLQQRYKVRFNFHLAAPPSQEEQGDNNRFSPWAVNDARSIAASYRASLPETVARPDREHVTRAENHLSARLDATDFVEAAFEVGEKLWSGIQPPGENRQTNEPQIGSRLRRRLGHWLGATFYFEGEWYWGVDRLLHLESRLHALGLAEDHGASCVPRPEAEPLIGGDASEVTLEYFPSLRSPYTAISFDRTITLARRTGVKLVLRPVMPMMMRGIPAPLVKQFYIMSDTRREADYYQQPFGPFVDPFGEPVKRAFALLPYMQETGRDIDFCSEYLRASWAEGLDVTTEKGLMAVVERSAGDWQAASASAETSDWERLLETNVTDMLDAGLWGVPSFRVSGGSQTGSFACWGQDRLWRVETEITRRAVRAEPKE